MDKLNFKIAINKRILTFLFVLFIIGIISGSLFVIVLKNADKTIVKTYLESFFKSVSAGSSFSSNLISNLIFNVLLIICIWLLGMSIIGLPIIIFIYFYKIFVLGFSIGTILLNYKLKGILISLLYVFPHQIFNIIIYIFLTMYALNFGIKLFDNISRKKQLNFKYIMNKYYMVLLISIITIIFTTIYEIFIMPSILRIILNIL